MKCIDVFNGDADGLLALHQLRLAEPAESVLVTGPKRDIELLQRVEAGEGDAVTVLDVSLDKNRAALLRVLENGAAVRYFDHHFAGDIPLHHRLVAWIDADPGVCTSLLVDRYLGGRHRVWAVAAAFGDNLHEAARQAAEPLALPEDKLAQLRELGECLNYNGYGESLEDLHFHPAELYRLVSRHTDPFAFMAEEAAFATLRDGYRADMARVAALQPEAESAGGAVYVLPDAPWSRRVSGVFANDLASAHRARAHAVLTRRSDGTFTVSVRAPKANPAKADELCRQFPSGGGRAAAAGINSLPPEQFDAFVARFSQTYAGG